MLDPMAEQTTSLAVLFADLGGSTQLYEELGDAEAQKIVAQCLELASQAVEEYDGRVIKTIGDEVMATFPTAENAYRAGSAILSRLANATAIHHGRLGAHVGFHFGPVIEEAGDVFGDTVNVAARIVSLAVDGENLTTREGVDALPEHLRRLARQIDRREIKGKSQAVEVFKVVEQSANLTAMISVPMELRHGPHRLLLRCSGEEFQVDPKHPSLSIGRSDENELVIPYPCVSRRHARIKMRKGNFVLFDESSNGTMVYGDEKRPVLLHRDNLILPARGRLAVKVDPTDDASELPIHFEVEAI